MGCDMFSILRGVKCVIVKKILYNEKLNGSYVIAHNGGRYDQNLVLDKTISVTFKFDRQITGKLHSNVSIYNVK
ncbi:unnamed protein product [Caenorhabditis nigoni]